MTQAQLFSASPNDIRAFAHSKLDKLQWTYTGDIWRDLSRQLPFDTSIGANTNYQELNLSLDINGCLGRAAIIGAFVEKYTNATIVAGEVIVDHFRELLGKTMQKIQDTPGYLEEVIMYEDPHIVPVINGIQYEPLSILMGEQIIHPKIETFPFWESIYSSMLCSLVLFEQNPEVKKRILDKASRYAITIDYLYTQGQFALEQGNAALFLKIAEGILLKKKSARAMAVICMLTGKYRTELTKEYTEKIFFYFKDLFE